MNAFYRPFITGLLLAAAGVAGHAQQIVCERLLTAPGLDVPAPTACAAPNGEFVISGAARPAGSTSTALATHTFVARLRATGCDTLWQRRLPHSVPAYAVSAVQADARGLWLLTYDTLVANTVGVRLWHLNSSGRVRQKVSLVGRTPREFPTYLLPATDGGVYALNYSVSSALGAPRAPAVLRFDSTGVQRWRHNYGFTAPNEGVNLVYTPTGTVLLAGMTGTNTNPASHYKLLEIEPGRGDSLRGVSLPWAPGVTYDQAVRLNNQPLDAIALRQGGYVLPSMVNASSTQTGQLTRVDAAFNVLWRYQLPITGSSAADIREVTQVRELADGTLVALVRLQYPGRTFWLYRLNATTGALLAIYPFVSAYSTLQLHPAHLLAVAADSTLLVVGSSQVAGTAQVGGIYVARLRVPGLPRVVTPALPLAPRPGRASVAFALYPNPAHDAVTVDVPAGSGAGGLELRDALGRRVRAQAMRSGAPPVQWSLTDLTPGLYVVVWHSAHGTAMQRLTVE
ncbi:T9SS type A sorting domain-containing protein [Hymenobacter rubidus]|uniref:T9SS type A sorting domain-containing protein n=1 Tax=Hymenobacter rubidus TaxID=1441626 RepID=UPI00191F9097|nr:T9SS type A sorting domain-containing protein [Hymenobacter rubidus]